MQYIGKYKILKKLGSGSFGFVYLAEDPKLHVQVAIKVFKVKDVTLLSQVTSASNDPESVLRQRFIEEAKALRELATTPNIVQMYEFDELEDGSPYYVMPFIQHTLVDKIGKDAFTQGALSELSYTQHPKRIAVNQAINYLKQLSQALCYVHKLGLVHRDIKPANILINEQNQVQLSDFGIAKLPLTEHSQTGFGMGSKNYMSPEQQESAKHVLPASDIYSLGVLAYRMLTGQLPVGRFQDPIEYAPEIGQPLNALIILALSQNVAQRPEDGTAFIAALNHAISSQESNYQAHNEDTEVWKPESKTQIKPELIPLKNKVTALLSSQGEIKATDLPLLQALGEVNQLDSSGLDAFIEHTIEQQSANSNDLASFILWMKTVNKHFDVAKQEVTTVNMSILMEVGLSTTNKTQEQLKALLETKQQEQLLATSDKKAAQGSLKKLLLNHHIFNNKQSQRFWGGLIVTAAVLFVLFAQYNSHLDEMKDDQQAWEYAKNNHSTESYTAYIQKLPEGGYIDDANKALAALLAREEILTASNENLRQQQIMNAQRQLRKHGFDVALSSELDSRTKSAIEAFEKNENLAITGDVDERLLSKLLSSYQDKDNSLWDSKQQEHSVLGYQQYLSTFPEGIHSHQAMKVIKQLTAEKMRLNKQKRQLEEKKRQAIIARAITDLRNNLKTLPSGKFSMGCNQNDHCKPREMPRHTVFITAYKIMKTEVTFALWDACVLGGGCSTQAKDEGWGRGNRPVIGVNYVDIVEQFIPWIKAMTGEEFSLPSEAQWEYAARAGSVDKFVWGSDIDCLKARFSQFSGGCGNERKTALVNVYAPNQFGLYDMYGNVWEWTQDCWHHNYAGAPDNGSAWNEEHCDTGVIRGGSWVNQADFLRATVRGRYKRSVRSNANGFRLVMSIKEQK